MFRKAVKLLRLLLGLPYYINKLFQSINVLTHTTSILLEYQENTELNFLLRQKQELKDKYTFDEDQNYDYDWYCMNYKSALGFYPNLIAPLRFTEKIIFTSLLERKPIYTKLADKYLARSIVEERIGAKYLLPLFWEGTDPNKIPFDSLPKEHVIKTNHSCGTNIIVLDNGYILPGGSDPNNIISFNKETIINQIIQWMSQNYYYSFREWQYKNIVPHILIEQYMRPKDKLLPTDYKLYCFNGRVEYIDLMSERTVDGISDMFYTREWTATDIFYLVKARTVAPKPDNLEELIYVAEQISAGISYARVDLYIYEQNIYFGEITFTPMGGYMQFSDKKFDFLLGEKWK